MIESGRKDDKNGKIHKREISRTHVKVYNENRFSLDFSFANRNTSVNKGEEEFATSISFFETFE